MNEDWKNGEHTKWFKKARGLKTSDNKDIEVWEFNHQPDEGTLSTWAKHFRNHYCLDEAIELYKSGTGLSKKDFLNSRKFPDKKHPPGPSIRSGDFSEILIADFFEFILKYSISRTRYRNKPNPNTSTQGVDIIGFKTHPINAEKDELIIIESKAEFTGITAKGAPNKSKNTMQEAIIHSNKDENRKSISLSAIKQKYLETNQNDKASQIERFQDIENKPYIQKYSAIAFFTKELKEIDSKLMQTDTSIHNNNNQLILFAFKGTSMMNLAHSLYKRAANEA